MTGRVLGGQVGASVLWYALLVAAAVAVDGALHRWGLGWVGRHLGPIGSVLLIGSFAYSLRKRRYFRAGSLPSWLDAHEVLSWLGTMMILVHAGVHVNAALPWLAVGAMLISVASGFTGKVLLARSRDSLRVSNQAMEQQGVDRIEIDRRLMMDSLAVSAMTQWRAVHLPITAAFSVLVLLHVVTVVALW